LKRVHICFEIAKTKENAQLKIKRFPDFPLKGIIF